MQIPESLRRIFARKIDTPVDAQFETTPPAQQIDSIGQSDSPNTNIQNFISEPMILPIVSAIIAFLLGAVVGAGTNRQCMQSYAIEAGVGVYRLDEKTGEIQFKWKTKE